MVFFAALTFYYNAFHFDIELHKAIPRVRAPLVWLLLLYWVRHCLRVSISPCFWYWLFSWDRVLPAYGRFTYTLYDAMRIAIAIWPYVYIRRIYFTRLHASLSPSGRRLGHARPLCQTVFSDTVDAASARYILLDSMPRRARISILCFILHYAVYFIDDDENCFNIMIGEFQISARSRRRLLVW